MARNPTMLYHYTSEEGYKGIKRTKRINESNAETSLNANGPWFGPGIYLTEVPPSATTTVILADTFNFTFVSTVCEKYKKTEYVFSFNFSSLKNLRRCGRDGRSVWKCGMRYIDLDRVDFNVERRNIWYQWSMVSPFECSVRSCRADFNGLENDGSVEIFIGEKEIGVHQGTMSIGLEESWICIFGGILVLVILMMLMLRFVIFKEEMRHMRKIEKLKTLVTELIEDCKAQGQMVPREERWVMDTMARLFSSIEERPPAVRNASSRTAYYSPQMFPGPVEAEESRDVSMEEEYLAPLLAVVPETEAEMNPEPVANATGNDMTMRTTPTPEGVPVIEGAAIPMPSEDAVGPSTNENMPSGSNMDTSIILAGRFSSKKFVVNPDSSCAISHAAVQREGLINNLNAPNRNAAAGAERQGAADNNVRNRNPPQEAVQEVNARAARMERKERRARKKQQ